MVHTGPLNPVNVVKLMPILTGPISPTPYLNFCRSTVDIGALGLLEGCQYCSAHHRACNVTNSCGHKSSLSLYHALIDLKAIRRRRHFLRKLDTSSSTSACRPHV